ncbi:MAG: IMP dehydrogenase [Bacteriovoracaceae bacterium]|nr:IMP dehydrogenase [Bacteriovoracaceae bacterium]
MSLIFSSDEILKRPKALTFNDVLLIPKHSEISSRHTPKLATRFTKNFNLDMPIIASNMDTVTEIDMAFAMAKLGGAGILHRFMDVQIQVDQIKRLKVMFSDHNITSPVCASIGVKEGGISRAHALAQAGVDILTVDIAHGDSVMMLETLREVKKNHPHIDIIAGNVATGDGALRLIDAGADAIKVGIGPGSMCTTRIVTGCGVPQLTAIALVHEAIKDTDIPLIADGGIKSSGDMVKSLCAGATTVMVGSLLAGTMETPGEIKNGKKLYRGMASKCAQVSWRGGVCHGLAPEGESTQIACKGSVENVIVQYLGGIRSAMTYLNASQVDALYSNAHFMEMSSSGFDESSAHGL